MEMEIPLTSGNPNLDPRIMPAVGQIVIRWARYENLLDWDIRFLRQEHRFRTRKIRNPLSHRLTFWKECCDDLFRGDQDLLGYANEIYQGAVALSEKRNCLTHGIWGQQDEGKPDAIRLYTYERDGGKLIQTNHEFSLDSLQAIDATIVRLHDNHHNLLLYRYRVGQIQGWKKGG